MLVKKTWQVCLILMHFFVGVLQLVRVGARQQPFDPSVRALICAWYRGLLNHLNIEVEVIGTTPHERHGAAVIVANHVSWVDIPLVGSLTPVNFLSKAEIADWPVVGRIARKIGTLFIARGSGDTEHVMQAMKEHLQQQRSVLIFPEGTTTDGSKVRRFHKKLFKVCEQTEVNLYPMLIRYHADAQPNPVPFVGDIGFGSHFWQLLGNGKIRATVEWLPPVKLDPELVGKQLREVELSLRTRLTANPASPPLPPANLNPPD